MKLKHIALAALMATASAASAEVKIALDGAPDPKVSGTYNWVMGFSEVLDKAGMKVREMPRDSVGNEAEKFDQLSTGLLELSLSDVRAIAQVDPFIYGLRLPYMFDDAAHMQRALADGKIFDRVNEAVAGQDVMLLAIVPIGPSSGIITTNAAAPSEMELELAAVTVPSLVNAGRNVGIFSGLALPGPSSVSTTTSPFRVLIVTSTISSLKPPLLMAS